MFDEHRRANARLTDFGGWEMPLHYGSQIEEHHRVRRDAGVFDVSHMLGIDLVGEAARAFLGRLLANDVARLTAPGKALYSCLLNDDGGILDDLIVYWLGGERFRSVVNAGTAQKDSTWIERQRDRLAPGVDLRARRDLAMLAVQGPQARERVWQARPGTRTATEALAAFEAREVDGLFIARTGYTGEDGFEIMLPAADAPALWRDLLDGGVAPCGLGARDTLRLEAGMNLYGQDMDESTTPYEAGLGWTVARSEGREFIGRRSPRAARPAFPVARTGAARQGRAAQSPARSRRERHGRDHQWHLLADAGSVDRTRAPAACVRARRHGRGRDSRTVARGPGCKIPVREARQIAAARLSPTWRPQ